MKRLSLYFFAIFFAIILSQIFYGCSAPKKVAVKVNEHIEVGWTPRSIFQSPSYAIWFDTAYSNYEPEFEYIENLKVMQENVEIIVVYATWCGDSKREMPRFFKIMDEVKFPPERITLIAVDRTMKIPEGIKEEYGITNVPTFIVKYKGMEIGRIIETPKETIEHDLYEYLSPFFPSE